MPKISAKLKLGRSRPKEAGNAGGVGQNWRLSRKNSLYSVTRKRRLSQALTIQFGRKLITLSVQLCLQHVRRDAVRRTGSSAIVDTDTCTVRW